MRITDDASDSRPLNEAWVFMKFASERAVKCEKFWLGLEDSLCADRRILAKLNHLKWIRDRLMRLLPN